MTFWANKRVLVTGGHGFIGSYVVERLRYLGAKVSAPSRAEFDLLRKADIASIYANTLPQIVIHLAASVGGLPANIANPGLFFYDNLKMGMEMMEVGRHYNLKKFVQMGSACEYPQEAPVPMREEDLWLGYPEITNAPYGIAKKALLVQGQAYREQYGMPVIHLLSTNLYGPGDDFDLNTSHVIPAVIKQCVAAQKEGSSTILLWGTGNATRDSLYVQDAVNGILLATERYDSPEPVNLGTGIGTSIREMAELIKNLTGFSGEFLWDASKPNGHLNRFLDISRAKKFGFAAKWSLEAGLQETISWYRKNGAK
jgi:GDP-L-fucose synthase